MSLQGEPLFDMETFKFVWTVFSFIMTFTIKFCLDFPCPLHFPGHTFQSSIYPQEFKNLLSPLMSQVF